MFRWSVLIATLAISVPAFAQTPLVPATIGGVLRDSSGGEVPGVTVRIVAEGTGTAVEAVSDAAGRYRSAVLPPGRYRVEVTLDGFEPLVRQTVVAADQPAVVDISLSPARLAEGVVVTARRVE
jgi:hypothetical protein